MALINVALVNLRELRCEHVSEPSAALRDGVQPEPSSSSRSGKAVSEPTQNRKNNETTKKLAGRCRRQLAGYEKRVTFLLHGILYTVKASRRARIEPETSRWPESRDSGIGAQAPPMTAGPLRWRSW